jgi:hypothetical protein
VEAHKRDFLLILIYRDWNFNFYAVQSSDVSVGISSSVALELLFRFDHCKRLDDWKDREEMVN